MIEGLLKNKFNRLVFISAFLVAGFFMEKSGLLGFFQRIFDKTGIPVVQADQPETECSGGGDCSSDCSSDCCSDCSGYDCCDNI